MTGRTIGAGGVKGVESCYVYVVDENGTMVYHPDGGKIGKSVENEVVKQAVQDVKDGKEVKSGVRIAVIAPVPKRTRTNAFTTISTPTFSSIFAMKLGLLPSAMFALARLIWHGKTT
jgi:hypothetical protein